jgi:aryl-alcohol dehydrogenase-like predicted oxidoreductase
LGAALGARRSQVQLHTKVGLLKREGLGKARVLAAADESLARLNTDQIDLYYLHAPDPKTPVEETLEAIAALLEAKKIRAWGVSNFAAWQVLELNLRCDALGLPRPARSQVLYNLLVRQLDVEYFAFARRHPIHTTVFNPLAGGLLARASGELPKGSRLEKNALYRKRYWSDPLRALTEALRSLGEAQGVDLVTLSYAWLAGAPGVDSILSGPGTLEHLEAALRGCAVVLDPSLRAAIDAAHQAYLGTDARYAR